MKELEKIQSDLKGKNALEILSYVSDNFGGKVSFASSLGLEDQVITHMIATNKLNIDIFTLDTGRLFPEIYELISEIEKKLGVGIKVLFPDSASVEQMVQEKGINLFYESVDNRKLCCKIRKIDPLKRALNALDGWVVGLRQAQSITREKLEPASWDSANNMLKFAPLYDWGLDQVWDYIRKEGVPYSSLHDKGFPSIGCAPCTRAVKEGEDIRSGRWWWEEPEQKECGLHIVDGKLVRVKKDQ